MSIGWKEHARILLDIKAMLEKPIVFRLKEFILPVDLKAGTRMTGYDAERSPLGNMEKVNWNDLEKGLAKTWINIIEK